MSRLLLSLLLFSSLAGCSAAPPELKLLQCKDFPVYVPSQVETAMGAESGADFGDAKATHSMCYWLQTESKQEEVVKFYKDKMAKLPEAKEKTGEDRYAGALFEIECKPPSATDKVASIRVLVEKETSKGKTVFRITESLKPGLKYPKD